MSNVDFFCTNCKRNYNKSKDPNHIENCKKPKSELDSTLANNYKNLSSTLPIKKNSIFNHFSEAKGAAQPSLSFPQIYLLNPAG